MKTEFRTIKVEIEIPVDVEFTINHGQRCIMWGDYAQEGIPAHVDDIIKVDFNKSDVLEEIEVIIREDFMEELMEE